MQRVLNIKILAIIFVSLLAGLLILWYIGNNPPPQIPIDYSAEVLQEILRDEIYKQISDLEIDIEISESLSAERLLKLQAELKGILTKELLDKTCVQYALVATFDDYYPCYNTGQMIYLKSGDVWKYGKTCIGADKRYSDLAERRLIFIPEFRGNEMTCLLIEKIKIYNYVVHSENLKRAKETKTLPLLRPPGNRIDR